MVKILIALTLISSSLFATDIFTTNCLSCHKDHEQLKEFMAEYTLKYSSEKNIKKNIFKFLRNPTSNKSIMPYSFIIEYGFKPESTLSDKELKKAIDIYYKNYNLKNFIR